MNEVTYTQKIFEAFLAQGFAAVLLLVALYALVKMYQSRMVDFETRLKENKESQMLLLNTLNTYSDSLRQLTEYLKARDKA